MGASIDAYDQAGKMGIGVNATMSYDSTRPEAARAAFRASGANTMSYAKGMAADVSYSASQKAEAGDKWDPARTMRPPTAAAAPPKSKAHVDEVDI